MYVRQLGAVNAGGSVLKLRRSQRALATRSILAAERLKKLWARVAF